MTSLIHIDYKLAIVPDAATIREMVHQNVVTTSSTPVFDERPLLCTICGMETSAAPALAVTHSTPYGLSRYARASASCPASKSDSNLVPGAMAMAASLIQKITAMVIMTAKMAVMAMMRGIFTKTNPYSNEPRIANTNDIIGILSTSIS